MDTVKNDLKEKVEIMEKMDQDKKKNDDLDILKTERDFFRQEAVRLNELCKKLSNSNDELISQNRQKETEIKHITRKFKESENINKQIIAELESNIKLIKKYENEIKTYAKMHQNFFINKNKNHLNITNIAKNSSNNINNNSNTNNNSKNQNLSNALNFIENTNLIKNPLINIDGNEINVLKLNSNNANSFARECHTVDKIKNINSSNTYNCLNLNNTSSYNQHNNSTEDMDYMTNNNYNRIIDETQKEKEKIIKIIEKLKFELKKEKGRNEKIIGELNRILLDKKKLEKIFMECVEESRQEIFQRRIRDTVQNAKVGLFGSFGKVSQQKLPTYNEIKFENFQSTDKRKLIETFLMKDEIIQFIREHIGNYETENKGVYFQNTNLNETLFNFRQSMTNFPKNNIKASFLNEFKKSQSSMRSSKSKPILIK